MSAEPIEFYSPPFFDGTVVIQGNEIKFAIGEFKDMEDGYAIFANGTLQFVSTADTRDEAYGEYAEEVGFDRSVYPMTSDDVSFHYIPASDMEKWEDADVNDHPTVNHPV